MVKQAKPKPLPRTTMRLPADLKAALDKAAKDDGGRTVTSLTIKILSDWLRERKYLK
jgi:hypothetical protein